MADVYLKAGDTAPVIARTLLDGDGNPVDIGGASVRFIMAPIRGGEPVIEDAASNDQIDTGTDGSKGQVSYDWGAVDIAPGGYRAEFEVTYGLGDIESFPNGAYLTVAVLDDLDAASSS